MNQKLLIDQEEVIGMSFKRFSALLIVHRAYIDQHGAPLRLPARFEPGQANTIATTSTFRTVPLRVGFDWMVFLFQMEPFLGFG